MRNILLAMVLVLVMAIPAVSAVKPTPMHIVVYGDVPVYGWVCPGGINWDGSDYKCGDYLCVYDMGILGCWAYAWVARPMYWQATGSYEAEINSAEVGDTYRVKGVIFSEQPRNIKYKLVIKNGATVVYKTPQIPFAPLEGSEEIQFDDFTFKDPGLYTFTLNIIKADGTIVKTSKNVFIPAPPGYEPAVEDEPVLEE